MRVWLKIKKIERLASAVCFKILFIAPLLQNAALEEGRALDVAGLARSTAARPPQFSWPGGVRAHPAAGKGPEHLRAPRISPALRRPHRPSIPGPPPGLHRARRCCRGSGFGHPRALDSAVPGLWVWPEPSIPPRALPRSPQTVPRLNGRHSALAAAKARAVFRAFRREYLLVHALPAKQASLCLIY